MTLTFHSRSHLKPRRRNEPTGGRPLSGRSVGATTSKPIDIRYISLTLQAADDVFPRQATRGYKNSSSRKANQWLWLRLLTGAGATGGPRCVL